MFRRSAAILLVALVGIAGSGSEPRAQGVPETEPVTPRILVLPLVAGPGVSSIVPGKVFEYFKAILIMNRALTVMTLDNLTEVSRSESAADSSPELLKEADLHLAEGKDLYDDGKYLAALNTFKKARTLYSKRFDLLENFDKFVDATLGVALSYFQTGYDDNGEDVLGKVLTMRPETALDKRKVPKAALDALDRMKKLNEAPVTARVVVKSSAAGASVFVDGISKGPAPVPIHGLMRGRHVLRVTAPGHLPWADIFVVGQEDLALQATLQPMQQASGSAEVKPDGLVEFFTRGNFDRSFLQAAAGVAQRYVLTAIVGSYIRKTSSHYEIAVFLFDSAQGHLAELEWVKLDHDLATMQVSLLSVEEGLQQALAVFPRTRVVNGRSSIYDAAPMPQPEVRPHPVAVEPRPVGNGSVLVGSGQKPQGTQVAAVDVRKADDPHRLGDYDTPPRDPPWEVKEETDEASWAEKNWWLWVVLGGLAVAGGVTAGVLVTQQQGAEPGFRATVSWTP